MEIQLGVHYLSLMTWSWDLQRFIIHTSVSGRSSAGANEHITTTYSDKAYIRCQMRVLWDKELHSRHSTLRDMQELAANDRR